MRGDLLIVITFVKGVAVYFHAQRAIACDGTRERVGGNLQAIKRMPLHAGRIDRDLPYRLLTQRCRVIRNRLITSHGRMRNDYATDYECAPNRAAEGMNMAKSIHALTPPEDDEEVLAAGQTEKKAVWIDDN